MRAGPPNPGPRSAATRAGMKSGPARIRGVSIVVPTCKPAKLRAAGTDFCGKLPPAQNRFSFCGPPECNGGPAGGTSRRKTVRIYSRPQHAALVGASPTKLCEVVRVTGTLKNVFCTRVAPWTHRSFASSLVLRLLEYTSPFFWRRSTYSDRVINVDLHQYHSDVWTPRYGFLQNRHLFWSAVLREMYFWCKA